MARRWEVYESLPFISSTFTFSAPSVEEVSEEKEAVEEQTSSPAKKKKKMPMDKTEKVRLFNTPPDTQYSSALL